MMVTHMYIPGIEIHFPIFQYSVPVILLLFIATIIAHHWALYLQ